AAFLAATMPHRVTTIDLLRVDDCITRMVRSGSLTVTLLPCTSGALRTACRRLYRVSAAGRTQLDRCRHACECGLHAIDRAAIRRRRGWASVPAIIAEGFSGSVARDHIHRRLDAMVTRGLLVRRNLPSAGTVTLIVPTRAGEQEWSRLMTARAGRPIAALSRPPRHDQAIHHLLTVQAALMLLRTGGRLLALLGDEALRSRTRRGVRFERGIRAGSLPDGRLYYLEGVGIDSTKVRRSIDIEVLVSGYSDKAIRTKVANLPPTSTRFFVPTARLRDRVHDLTGVEPHVMPRPHRGPYRMRAAPDNPRGSS
ncbi:MAG: hypothetical protein M3081_04565, partial [Gemmatimonadota bacterium]|nr:hypothetical protein [Gemmatimonadota bacterium]